MSVGYFLRVGDSTTCGGKILTGDPTFQWYGVSAAREGDMVTCGKYPGTFKILGGVVASFDEGQALAGSLDSFSSCPCQARFIPTILDSYSKDDVGESENPGSTLKESKLLIEKFWIGFSLPTTENYSGLGYRLTMDDGSVYEGIFDKTNKISISSLSANSCASIEIENPDNDHTVGESMTSQLLKNIMR